MGHLAIEKPYLELQERLHKNPIGAPATKELFDDPDSVTSRGMSLALGALLALPPAKQLLAIDQIKSTFVKTIVDGAKKGMEQATAGDGR